MTNFQQGLNWNPNAHLVCVSCQSKFELGVIWTGCPTCGDGSPLVVGYAEIPLPDGPADLAKNASYLAEHLLPVASRDLLNLGQGNTPLLPAHTLGENIWLKIEGQNPTGSHKDRFHAISEAIARGLGYKAAVTSSTGNHGASCAAYSAAAGLDSLVLLNPDSPPALRSQIRSYGGAIAVLPGQVSSTISRLVDGGWYPSTGADPSLVGRGNPYGTEGYKKIAYEIFADLGRIPDVVAIPAASGDTYFGIWKGFRELHERLGLNMPLLLACQPVGSAPLSLTEKRRATAPQVVKDARSLAISARDDRSGWHATLALRANGAAIEVSEDDLCLEVKKLGRLGLCVEPASALATAGLRLAKAAGLTSDYSQAVAIITSSGLNWTRDLDIIFGEAPRVFNDTAALDEYLASKILPSDA